jgi:hypothetical protein
MSAGPTPHNEGPRALLYRALGAFVGEPASARPLAALRIGLAVVLLGQALAIAGSLYELYGDGGYVQWALIESFATPGTPRLSWFARALGWLGLGPAAAIRAVFLTYLGALVFLLVGWHTRIAALVAWLTHLAMNVTGGASIYGVDQFANIALFYCLLFPVAHSASLDLRAGRCRGEPSPGARLALRVLQIHLCIVYFTSGLAKAEGPNWYNGEVIWESLLRPDMAQFDLTWLAWYPWIPTLAGWGTLFLEIGYPALVFFRQTRRAGVLGIVGMHVGIAVFLGLWSFSAVMIVLNVAAFLVSPEPS